MMNAMHDARQEAGDDATLERRGRRSWGGRVGRALLAFLLVGVVLLAALDYALLSGAVDIPMQYLRDGQPAPETASRAPGSAPERRVEVDAALVAAAPGKGDPDAPVLMIEFSDFQCGFCKGWTTEVAPHLQPYIDRGVLRLVLLDVSAPYHEFAGTAARAAHCARASGGDAAYWTMHDALFATMNEWGQVEAGELESALGRVASGAGLDGAAVTVCLAQELHGDRVAAGMEEAARIGVMGTPTFVVNGTVIYGLQPVETFEQVIDQALRERR